MTDEINKKKYAKNVVGWAEIRELIQSSDMHDDRNINSILVAWFDWISASIDLNAHQMKKAFYDRFMKIKTLLDIINLLTIYFALIFPARLTRWKAGEECVESLDVVNSSFPW